MLKKILFISLALLLILYILFSVIYINPKAGKDLVCTQMEVVIVDTLKRHFIGTREIESALETAGLNPVGKNMSEIEAKAIEELLLQNQLIKKADCYKTIGGTVKMEIYQKIPILRVISASKSYYIDNEGGIMPVADKFTAYLPVATGNIEEEYATTNLYEFALFLQDNKFWNSQIEQIYVSKNKEVELTPRIGDFQIVLGNIENYREKLEKLKLFYEKGLNEVGWNRYSVINLKYKDQVVCTKK